MDERCSVNQLYVMFFAEIAQKAPCERGCFICSNCLRYTFQLDIMFKKLYRRFSVGVFAETGSWPFTVPVNGQQYIISTVVIRDWSDEIQLDFFVRTVHRW